MEQVFRDLKSVLETRPIYHQRDETIRGHVFCSFLALVMRKELNSRLEEAGFSFEWAEIKRKTHRKLSADEKIRIVWGGKNGGGEDGRKDGGERWGRFF